MSGFSRAFPIRTGNSSFSGIWLRRTIETYLKSFAISSNLIEQSADTSPSLHTQVPFVQLPLKLQSLGHKFWAIFTGGTIFPWSSFSQAVQFLTAWKVQDDLRLSNADSTHSRSPVACNDRQIMLFKPKILREMQEMQVSCHKVISPDFRHNIRR